MEHKSGPPFDSPIASPYATKPPDPPNQMHSEIVTQSKPMHSVVPEVNSMEVETPSDSPSDHPKASF